MRGLFVSLTSTREGASKREGGRTSSLQKSMRHPGSLESFLDRSSIRDGVDGEGEIEGGEREKAAEEKEGQERVAGRWEGGS